MSEEIKSPIFAVFHPQGGRKVVNIDELPEHELRVLQVSGWCQSPLEFWPSEKVAEQVAAGFFNCEHNWERKYESVIQGGSESEQDAAAVSPRDSASGEDLHAEDGAGDSGDGSVGRSEVEDSRTEVEALRGAGSGLSDEAPSSRPSDDSVQRSEESAKPAGVRCSSGKSRKR